MDKAEVAVGEIQISFGGNINLLQLNSGGFKNKLKFRMFAKKYEIKIHDYICIFKITQFWLFLAPPAGPVEFSWFKWLAQVSRI